MIFCNQIIDVQGSIFTDCEKVCTGYVCTGLQAGMMENQHLPPEKIQNMSETGWPLDVFTIFISTLNLNQRCQAFP